MLHLRRILVPLVLAFALCDADSKCSTMFNPLTLDPHQVIAEYGQEVEINCTNSDKDSEGMYWKVGNVDSEWQYEQNYFLLPLTLSEWNIKAECFAVLNETFECSKDVDIIIYKTPDIVTISSTDLDKMVEGSEYLLNCHIINVAPVQNLRVKWYRGNDTVYTQTFNETSVTPVNVTSTLRDTAERNYHGALFRCEAELHLGPNGPEVIPTAASPSYNATVFYKPLIRGCSGPYTVKEHNFSIATLPCRVDGNPPPTVRWYFEGKPINPSEPLNRTGSGKYTADVTNIYGTSSTSVYITIEYAPVFKMNFTEVHVFEGEDISLVCDAEGYPPPKLKWTCDGLNLLENTHVLNTSQIRNSTTCKCTAINFSGNITKEIHVGVIQMVAPTPAMTNPRRSTQIGCPLTLMPSEVIVRFGDRLSINCSTSSNNVLELRFEVKIGRTDLGEHVRSAIWVVGEVQQWAIEAKCSVNVGGTWCSERPNVTVYKTPDIVAISATDLDKMVEGSEYLLNCHIINVAPVQNLRVKWYRGNDTVYTQTFNDTSVTPINVTSTLRDTAERNYHGALFRCEAELHLGPNGPEVIPTAASPSYNATVFYKPLIRGCSGPYTVKEHNFSIATLPCRVDGNPPPTVRWYFEGKPINPSEPLNRTGSGKYTADVTNIYGTSSTSVDITIEYAPVFKMNFTEVHVFEGEDISLVCDAEGYPPPKLKWTCDGLNLLENTHVLNTSQIRNSTTCKCTAINFSGNITKEIHVGVIQMVAPTPAMTNPRRSTQIGCPLTLMPAEVIVRFGDRLSINCSTSSNNVLELRFEVKIGRTDLGEHVRSAIWVVGEVQQWAIEAKCSVNVGGTWCSERPNVTVYKTPDIVAISATDLDKMVEGSEYLLNCHIINVAPVQNLRVKWYRGNDTVYTQTFNDTSVTPINVTSTLRDTAERNYHGALFRCEAELHLGPNGPEVIPTAASPSYNATVFYKPLIRGCSGPYTVKEHNFSIATLPCRVDGNPPPTVRWYFEGKPINPSEPLNRTGSGKYTADVTNIYGTSSTSVDITIEYAPVFKMNFTEVHVFEGEDISLVCDAEGYPPPKLKWTCDGLNLLENTHVLNTSQIRNSTTCKCTAINFSGNITKEIHVGVIQMVAPTPAMTNPRRSTQIGCPLTLMPAEVIVRFGDRLSINCSTSSNNVLELRFEVKIGRTDLGEHVRSAIWVVGEVQQWAIEAKCSVNVGGTWCSERPNVTVYKTPDIVAISATDLDKMVEGSEYLLNCHIINVAPVQNLRVKWYRGNDTVYTQTFNDTSVTPINVTSTLRDTAERNYHGALFRCEAELHLGPNGPEVIPTAASPSYNATVFYKPLIRGCSGPYTVKEHNFSIATLPCRVDGNPPPTVRWYFEGKPINPSEPLNRTGSGKYTADVTNIYGTSSTSVDITIEYAPVFKMNFTEVHVFEGEDISLVCDAEGYPPPKLKWTCDGLNLLENTHVLNTSQIRNSTTCKCTAINFSGNITKEIHVGVIQMVAPTPAMTNPRRSTQIGCPLTLMPAEVIVRFGDRLSINCSTSSNNVLELRFEVKIGRTDLGEHVRSAIWVVGEVQQWAIEAKCSVNVGGTWCSERPNVTVYKTPDIVAISATDLDKMVEGSEYLLNCHIINVAPVQNLRVKWYRGNDTVYTQTFNDTSVTPINVTSTLRDTAERNYHGALFRCEAELHLGPNGPEVIPTAASPSYNATVFYKPLIRGCSGPYTVKEHNFSIATLPCRVDGNPPPTVRWYFEGKPINPSEPLNRTGSGKYTADVTNIYGTSSTSVDITIEYAPVFKMNFTEVHVFEGEDISLVCDAEGYPPPKLKWTCDGLNLLENTHVLNTSQIRNSTTCKCTAINFSGNITKEIHVGVIQMVAPTPAMTNPRRSTQIGCPLTLMPAEVIVRFGDRLSINCSTSSNNVLELRFEVKIGRTDLGEHVRSAIWVVGEVQQWAIEAKCSVNVGGTWCSERPNVTVYKTPDIVAISATDLDKMVEGSEYLLNCHIINVAPVQNLRVKWYRGNDTVYTQTFNDTSVTPINVTSTLRDTAERNYHGALFRCEAELHLGPNGPEVIPTAASPSYNATVFYKPLIRGCSGPYTVKEHNFSIATLPCRVDGNPPPTVRWYFEGKPINPSEPLNRTGSGKYTADVTNIYGTSSTSVYITIEYRPSFNCKQHYEVQEDDILQILCEPEGIPRPTITWIKDGETIATPDRWTKHHSGNYSLRATNNHGTASQMIYLDVLYAPVLKLRNHIKEVIQGENVTFDCAAEGNPPPEIRWDYTSAVNVMQTTGGRQKSIRITGATSTNAGVYSCVATNKVASVTTSVTLALKAKTTAFSANVIWGLISVIFILVLILILIVLYHKRWKKHRQYIVVPDKPIDSSDGSTILMTTTSGGLPS